jgi:hypothetical protein
MSSSRRMYSRSREVKGQGAGVVRPVMVAIVRWSHCRPNGAQLQGGVVRLLRSLAAEANDCFMVRPRHGANRIQGCGASFCAQWRDPLGSYRPPQSARSQCHAAAYRRNTMNKHDGEPNLIKRCGRICSCFASEAAQSDLRLSMKPILRTTMVEHRRVGEITNGV